MSLGLCSVQSAGGVPCTRDAADYMRRICLHEHVRMAGICAQHIAEGDAGLGGCGDCWLHATEPHWCPITMEPAAKPEGGEQA